MHVCMSHAHAHAHECWGKEEIEGEGETIMAHIVLPLKTFIVWTFTVERTFLSTSSWRGYLSTCIPTSSVEWADVTILHRLAVPPVTTSLWPSPKFLYGQGGGLDDRDRKRAWRGGCFSLCPTQHSLTDPHVRSSWEIKWSNYLQIEKIFPFILLPFFLGSICYCSLQTLHQKNTWWVGFEKW